MNLENVIVYSEDHLNLDGILHSVCAALLFSLLSSEKGNKTWANDTIGLWLFFMSDLFLGWYFKGDPDT